MHLVSRGHPFSINFIGKSTGSFVPRAFLVPKLIVGMVACLQRYGRRSSTCSLWTRSWPCSSCSCCTSLPPFRPAPPGTPQCTPALAPLLNHLCSLSRLHTQTNDATLELLRANLGPHFWASTLDVHMRHPIVEFVGAPASLLPPQATCCRNVCVHCSARVDMPVASGSLSMGDGGGGGRSWSPQATDRRMRACFCAGEAARSMISRLAFDHRALKLVRMSNTLSTVALSPLPATCTRCVYSSARGNQVSQTPYTHHRTHTHTHNTTHNTHELARHDTRQRRVLPG